MEYLYKKTMKLSLFVISCMLLVSCSLEKTQAPEFAEVVTSSWEILVEETFNKITEEIEEELREVAVEEVTPKYLQIEKDWDNLVFERVLSDNSVYTRYQISYTSEGLSISGIMNIPKWDEAYPLLILNHGYIDPAVYTLWRGLKREQDYFARNGFAVLHTDYRNHAFSDDDLTLNGLDSILRSKKYWADAINAILAVQNAKEQGVDELSSVDSESVWMLGHSMGWWVTMYSLVSEPNLIWAAVLYAPVHSNEYYNFLKWWKNRLNSEQLEELSQRYWNPNTPESFVSISPETYFQNIDAPIQMYFGTNDQSCPISWGYEIETAFNTAKKELDFIVYDWEKHEFWPQWWNFMNSSKEFFTTHLK